MKIVRLQVLSCGALVSLALLAPALAGCASSKSSPGGSSPKARPSPSVASLVGFWRNAKPSPDWQAEFAGPTLIEIQRRGSRYFFQDEFMRAAERVTVEANRFVTKNIVNLGDERDVISLARNGSELTCAVYRGPQFSARPTFVEVFQRVSGSATALAWQVAHGQDANFLIQNDIDMLAGAIELWNRQYGSYPPREALLPGGAFWQWRHAPHFTSAVPRSGWSRPPSPALLKMLARALRIAATGVRMRLAKGPGNFDYTTNATRTSYTVSGHLYGGSDASESAGPGP